MEMILSLFIILHAQLQPVYSHVIGSPCQEYLAMSVIKSKQIYIAQFPVTNCMHTVVVISTSSYSA